LANMNYFQVNNAIYARAVCYIGMPANDEVSLLAAVFKID